MFLPGFQCGLLNVKHIRLVHVDRLFIQGARWQATVKPNDFALIPINALRADKVQEVDAVSSAACAECIDRYQAVGMCCPLRIVARDYAPVGSVRSTGVDGAFLEFTQTVVGVGTSNGQVCGRDNETAGGKSDNCVHFISV